MRRAKPSLILLDEEQIEYLHETSLQLLASTGVRVDSERARRLFARAVGKTAIDGDQVFLPRELVEWALESAPQAVDVWDRRGNLAFRIPDQARFGIGVTALHYQDPETDQVTPFTRRDMQRAVRLGQALSSYDVVSTVGIIQDVSPEVSDLYATLEMVANTTKPLVLLVSADESFRSVLELVEHLHGDPYDKPFILPYLNPISPLVINRGSVDKMWLAVERGLPVIYSNYGMAGASTPIVPGAALALLNAELLAGLTLSQLIREGTAIILGSLPAFFDMKGMGSFYDPLSYVMDLACAEMMAHYHLAHCGTSGSGMGWGPDLIAAGHQWMNHLLSCVGKVGLVPFVGDNLGAKAFSPALVVYANEIIAQARRFAQGFVLDDTAEAAAEIVEIGPGGTFLMSERTLRLFRSAYYQSPIFANLTLETWLDAGCPRADAELRRYACQLMEDLRAPEDHEELLTRGQAMIGNGWARG
jgi:trimethylamine--corrinoid protein Co-methyltransferase